VARQVERLITEMLSSWKVKNWFRSYFNLGFIAKTLGQDRLHPCSQGTDSVFVDPWGDVYGCNVRNDLHMGNLRTQSWQEICEGELAQAIRSKVAGCPQNWWMVSSAKTAIRSKHFVRLPKISVLRWVVRNKVKLLLGMSIAFDRYADYAHVSDSAGVTRCVSYLDRPEKKVLQPAESRRYRQLDSYFSR
jgi:hypothetical protein